MKGFFAAAMLAALLPITAAATTLHLSGDIDLLVLDGKRVSGSFLRGADSIELDNGPHQVVFRVEKNLVTASRDRRLYVSPPLVMTFDTRNITQVNFSLPRIETEKESDQFDASPRVQLLDGTAAPIPARLDVLAVDRNAKTIDYEWETERYNKTNNKASAPEFITMMADDSALLSGPSELDRPVAHSQTLTEQRLKHWYLEADNDTRTRFLEWVKQQPSS
ncbi:MULTISPECIES: curli synthesis inhibitor [Atlantibacter]|uniref:UPF0319 protein EH105704_01_04290 n=1 Tax=Atlantibacter hermannii NBRC 105704 TaxID=1115512 RepID=H5UWY8_ATLHE|nr:MULTISPECIES: DUF2057 family protein [Atlantibacter]MCQ4966377.1 DUF2057 family protein [Enterobacteriaceae bacterium DFI.7.85]HAI51336.1 DUF2057 domain-containing protein [Enterobacteriaceae bacterium]KIU35372.1 hypothetical protein SR38_03030 [Atlantibacter hermannii]MBW9431273.1 DUF2057 family protein [Atlantibacter hermannii]MDQ7880549.1 DUF2057 family protein [Atlantibacter hermannii]